MENESGLRPIYSRIGDTAHGRALQRRQTIQAVHIALTEWFTQEYVGQGCTWDEYSFAMATLHSAFKHFLANEDKHGGD